MNWTQIRDAIANHSGLTILEMVPLKNYTSLDIGGPARLFATVTSAAAAAKLLKAATQLQLPALILGGGTNLLVSDDGFEGLAIHTDFKDIHICQDTHRVTAGATVRVAELVSAVIDQSLGGMEFASGLPGTVGGAVAGNAGCFGSSFGEILTAATILTPEGVEEAVLPEYFEFEYRRSIVRDMGVIVASATFQLHPDDQEVLRKTADAHLELRRTRHPGRHMKTAGSYFKNLPPLNAGEHRRAAGALLEAVGAKQMAVGDAAVFEKHANILINRGNATARDMLTLEARLKQKVFERFGVALDPEVRFVGKRPDIVPD